MPNPRRVAAGRRNRLKRRGLTEEGRAKLRQSALANQPWAHSTGPRTPEGKARTARNGKLRQKGVVSLRELRRELTQLNQMIRAMADVRGQFRNHEEADFSREDNKDGGSVVPG